MATGPGLSCSLPDLRHQRVQSSPAFVFMTPGFLKGPQTGEPDEQSASAAAAV